MTMTKAELRTLRESLGLTPPLIAARAHVHYNVIWRQESASSHLPVTEQVADALYALAGEFEAAVARVAALAAKKGRIERATSTEEFEAAVPELRGWPDRSQGLFYDAVAKHPITPTTARIEYTQEATR